jgi:hypothetical protein
MTAPFDNGVAIVPMAHDKLSSTNQIAATDPVPVPGGAWPFGYRRSHISSTRYEGRPVTRPPEQLHLHPALHQIGWQDAVGELNQAALSGAQFVAVEPVLTTTAGIILSGFGRWRLALFEGRTELNCIEYPFDEEQALKFMLSHHQIRRGWNPFVRTELALKLEPSLQREALANMQAGGKYKGLAKLPEALQIDVREKIAELAGVCARNVGKVKDILKNAHPGLIEALRNGVLSINCAATWCRMSKHQQAEELTRHLCDRAVNKVIRQSIPHSREAGKGFDTTSLLNTLQRQEEQQPGSVEVRLGRSPRTVIVIGKDLSGPLSQQELKLP